MKQLEIILANVLEIDIDQITDETSPDHIENWDSFNHLMLISEIETKFDVKFTMDEVGQIKKVSDIKSLLKKYNVRLMEG